MTPERQLVIIEHQTLDITHHLGRALHNTHQSMQDGYPTRSPGDGNPGGGSITATSRPPRHALLTRPDPARIANDDIHDYTTRCANHANHATLTILQHPIITCAPHPINQAVHTHRIARLLGLIDPTRLHPLDTWLTDTNHLHRTILRWAWTTHTPTRTSELLATDLTDTLCRRHLAHGYRQPRHRGDLCRWCYTHQAEHGELPTDPMIDAHHDGNWRRLARLINARKLERRTRKRHR